MATGGRESSDTFDDSLNCGICIEALKNPKTLPNCFHSFCLECLQGYVDNQFPYQNQFPCPSCRETVIIPRGGLSKLRKSFLLDRVATAQPKPRNACSKHPKEELQFLCLDDEKILCRDCATKEHRKHNYVNIPEDIKDPYTSLNHELGLMTSLKEKLKDERRKVLCSKEVLKSKINTRADKIIEDINSYRKQLLDEVQRRGYQDTDKLDSQLNSLQGVYKSAEEMKNDAIGFISRKNFRYPAISKIKDIKYQHLGYSATFMRLMRLEEPAMPQAKDLMGKILPNR